MSSRWVKENKKAPKVKIKKSCPDSRGCRLLLHTDRRPLGAQLLQGGELVVVLYDISVKDSAVILCHVQGTVSQEFLQGKGISSAVYKVLPGKGMAECVD